MLYRLSKFIPVRMTSNYRASSFRSVPGAAHRSTWWQWRGRVLRHRVTVKGSA